MLERIRIVLVNTSHPGNIGSTARAMKTMGLTQLVLVSPESFPDPKAIEMSSHADDILSRARVVNSLEEALAGCTIAIGTSARSRAIGLPPLAPKASAEKLMYTLQTQPGEVALVLGREHAGLTNEELLHCHYHVCIPSNPEYSSLNLAAAAQVLCYEIRLAYLANSRHPQNDVHSRQPQNRLLSKLATEREVGGDSEHRTGMCTRVHEDSSTDSTNKFSAVVEFRKKSNEELATIDNVEQFYTHLQTVLIDLDFLKKENPALMPKVRRLFNRIHLEKNEVHILRGILTAVQKRRHFEST